MLAIPSTMVRKMTGAITILIRFTNTSPSGRIAFAVSGATSPSTTASAMATRTWTVRFRWMARGILQEEGQGRALRTSDEVRGPFGGPQECTAGAGLRQG